MQGIAGPLILGDAINISGGGGECGYPCINLSQLWSLVTILIAGQDEEQNQGSGSDVDLLWDSSSEVDLRERLDIRRNGFLFWKSSSLIR
jgi:hypothetical protein